ncbi:helix-turn-helix domain-containing protein [Nocardia sp. R16R-3T]
MFAKSAVTGPLLRELRTAAGISLRTMAIRTSFAVSYLSEVETGRKPMSESVIEAYRKVLGDPTIGLADVDIDRLAATVADPAHAGQSGLSDIAVILERTRHLEDQVGSSLVAPVIRGIDGVAQALAAERAGGSAAAGLAAEVSRYRGWLEHAIGRPVTADKSLADAFSLAEIAGDDSQQAHSLSFRSYVARHAGDLPKAVALAEDAIRAEHTYPALRAFDRYWRAELLAAQGDVSAAARALHAADKAAYAAEGTELPAYGYWYLPGFLAVQRGVVLATMGRKADAIREATQGVAAMPADHQRADWLAAMLAQIEPEWGGTA